MADQTTITIDCTNVRVTIERDPPVHPGSALIEESRSFLIAQLLAKQALPLLRSSVADLRALYSKERD